jgi:putative FmdB family regulatory protein
MPIYNFRCTGCSEQVEKIIPISERDTPFIHSCGATMERLMSVPLPAIFITTGRDKVINTLNNENGKGVRSERSTMALARGLDQPHNTIGIGFGKGKT